MQTVFGIPREHNQEYEIQ